MTGRAAVCALAIFAGVAAQDKEPKLNVVRVLKYDAGQTTRFDPGRAERNYRTVAADLERILSRFEKKAPGRLEDGYDAGLPDPVRTVRRTWRPSTPLPEPIRGTTIHVVTVDRDGRVHGLPEGGSRRKDIILISRAAKLSDCVRLGQVTLLTRDLAARLGLRSSRNLCVVSADGKAIEITEGEAP